MTGRTVHRLDARGTVRDWLATSARGEPVRELPQLLGADGDPWGPNGRWVLTNGPDVTGLKSRLHALRPLPAPDPSTAVVEGGVVERAGPTGATHRDRWERVHTGDDGLVDWSAFCFTPAYRTAAAATVLEVDQAEWRTLRVASTGPVTLVVGGVTVLETDTVTYMEPAEHEVRVWLASGQTPVQVHCWQVGFRECRHVVGLRIGGLPVRVVLPAPGADEAVAAVAEQVLEAVGTPRWAVPDGRVELSGPVGAALRVRVDGVDHRVRLDGRPDEPTPVPTGRASIVLAGAAGPAGPGSASMLDTGERVLRVSLDDDRSPVFRDLPVGVLPPRCRTAAEGEPAQWRAEFLAHAAARRAGSAATLAAAELDGAHVVGAEALAGPLHMIDSRADCADFEALGLLHLLHRLPGSRWEPGLRDRVEAALLGFKYWIDQPGLDAMCYFTENHQLVWHVAELLAGERFADATFDNTGWRGREHAAHARPLVDDWIARRLAGGFSEFDSNAYLAIDTLALVSLVEFARDPDVADAARALLDKLLFTLAANSWRGVHGSPHGRSYVPTLRSSRFEETASIMWVCWGVGALNDAVLPAAALATARRYRVPAAVRRAAEHAGPEWSGRQCYRGELRPAHDLLARPFRSDVVVFRTPDAMLACAEDYRPGLPGLQEHIWGATLAPEFQVYVTHAPNSATGSSARPNAWAGHRVLPRARQHRDTVLAVHDLPPDDPTGRVHAWFPLAVADEWCVDRMWTAARIGDGYVALATEGGTVVTGCGPDAGQELRARGPGVAWVCVIGRRADDGTFAEFVAALGTPRFAGPALDYRTRRGVDLHLDRDGPFTIDGVAADLDASGRPRTPLHLDNPLCRVAFGDAEMVIGSGPERHVIPLRPSGTGR